jgi:hypothetical protein
MKAGQPGEVWPGFFMSSRIGEGYLCQFTPARESESYFVLPPSYSHLDL